MPTLTRWYIKSGIIYLLLSFLLALFLKIPQLNPFPQLVAGLQPVYFHTFMVGWITQLIFGVAHWMFPRHSRENPRGNLKIAWTTFILLNTGLFLRIISEPFLFQHPVQFVKSLLIISAVSQWLAAIGFSLHIWKRIK